MTRPSATTTSEQTDTMDAQSGALDARFHINQCRISTLKVQLLDLKDHKTYLTRGVKEGGIKCICCNQLIAYSKKVFECSKCKTDLRLYFEEQETTLRKQIKTLEDELLTI